MQKPKKMGTVMGKTRGCAISTVVWFFGERRVPQIAARVEQISEWITVWRGFDVAQGAEFVRPGEKGSLSGKIPQKMEPSDRPNLCHYLFSLGSGLEAEHTRFWQAPEASATLDGALFNKAQIIESFSKDMEMQTREKAAGHPLSMGTEKGITTDFAAKKAGSQLIKEGNFMAARALDFLVCGAINEPHLPADGSIPNQFFVFVATREPWPPGNTNNGNVQETV